MATDTKITRTAVEKWATSAAVPVKMLIPFGLQCVKCGRPTNKGDRLWAVKEETGKDSSFDVEIHRFQIKCPSCRSAFSIKTDPGRYDYVLESGTTLIPRN